MWHINHHTRNAHTHTAQYHRGTENRLDQRFQVSEPHQIYPGSRKSFNSNDALPLDDHCV